MDESIHTINKRLRAERDAARAGLAVERRALEVATEGRIWGSISLLEYSRRKARAELAKEKADAGE